MGFAEEVALEYETYYVKMRCPNCGTIFKCIGQYSYGYEYEVGIGPLLDIGRRFTFNQKSDKCPYCRTMLYGPYKGHHVLNKSSDSKTRYSKTIFLFLGLQLSISFFFIPIISIPVSPVYDIFISIISGLYFSSTSPDGFNIVDGLPISVIIGILAFVSMGFTDIMFIPLFFMTTLFGVGLGMIR